MAWSKLYTIAYQEKPISSTKYNAEIDSIYEKLNLLKKSHVGSTQPTDFEIGQLWFDALNQILKIRTSSGVLPLAYANNESNIRSDNNPVFLTLDGSRTMNSSYNPSQDKHVTTKDYVDNLVSSHTSNTSNPHQTKESQVRDDTSPVFLTLDGTRQMSSSYTPSQNKDVVTKDYVDSHTSNLNNPHQTKEGQVRDDTSPVFLTVDGTRQLASGYTPENVYDIATKGYVDTMVATGGVGSIASDYVTYSPSTPTVSVWTDVTNVKEALDLIIDELEGGIVSDTYMVKLSEADTNPDYLLGKVDTNYFEENTNGQIKLKDSLLYKVKVNSDDTSPDYLVSKFSPSYFELDAESKIKLLDSLLYKVKMDTEDTSTTYLAERFDVNIFDVTLDKKITIKEKGLNLTHIDSGISVANKFPLTNSYGDFYLASIDTNVFNVSPALTLKDGAITTEKLASDVLAPNSDKLDGYHASSIASAYVIPITDATGKISADFLPDMSDADTLDGYHASPTAGANLIPVSDSNGYFNKWGAVNWVEKQQVISNATGNITWDMDNGGVLKLDPMVGNITLTVTNARYPATYILIAVQDSTGGRNITFPVNFKFQSGETIDTTASKINVISIFYDGTYFYCSVTVY